jgi:hypothetical protein
MSDVLALVRPDDWNFPLFLHVLGAMILVGGIATAAVAQYFGWRRAAASDAQALARMSFRSLLLVAVPGWIVMRIGAQWIASKEGVEDASLTWVDIGYVTAEGGGVLLLAATVLAGLGARRLARSGAERSGLVRASTPLVTIILVAYLVAVWAMTAKVS